MQQGSQQQPDAPPVSRHVKRQLKAAARGFTAESPKMLAAIAQQQQPQWQFDERKRQRKEKGELRRLLHQSYDEHTSTKQVMSAPNLFFLSLWYSTPTTLRNWGPGASQPVS